MKPTSPARLLKYYKRFVDVSYSLASTLELEPLLTYIMEAGVDLVEAEEASILLYDQHTHRLYFEAATNSDKSPELKNMFVPEESIAGWVALNRLPQIVNNVKQDERHFDDIEKEVNLVTRSLVAVPLVAKEKLIGVLEVLNKKEGNFNREDQEILLALASQAAIAIENSRLFQQSDLIAEFVHELRTPMASITTASYLLQRPEIDPAQRIKMAQTIYQETQRLNELASIFLDLASLESGRAAIHLGSVPIQPLMAECLQVLQMKAGEKGIKLILDAADDLPELEADRDKIKQVVLNLLNNAIKYNRPQGSVWLRAWREEEYIYLQVKDSGVGIPTDQISQLFTRFFRARNVERTTPGTGLGLSISRRIVEMHSGEIQVESELEVGTTFTIKLPLKQKAS
jgi:signal transduction histidine kinase